MGVGAATLTHDPVVSAVVENARGEALAALGDRLEKRARHQEASEQQNEVAKAAPARSIGPVPHEDVSAESVLEIGL